MAYRRERCAENRLSILRAFILRVPAIDLATHGDVSREPAFQASDPESTGVLPESEFSAL
jgi:hypothetical protein